MQYQHQQQQQQFAYAEQTGQWTPNTWTQPAYPGYGPYHNGQDPAVASHHAPGATGQQPPSSIDAPRGTAYYYQRSPAMHPMMLSHSQTYLRPQQQALGIGPQQYSYQQAHVFPGQYYLDPVTSAAGGWHSPVPGQQTAATSNTRTQIKPSAGQVGASQGAANSNASQSQALTTPARSPRATAQGSNSINGSRMNAFVFPSPGQSAAHHQSIDSDAAKTAGSSSSSTSGVSGLPPKPSFDPAGPSCPAATPVSLPIVPQMKIGPPTSSAERGQRSAQGSVLRGRSSLGSQMLDHLPPLQAVPDLQPPPPSLQPLVGGPRRQESLNSTPSRPMSANREVDPASDSSSKAGSADVCLSRGTSSVVDEEARSYLASLLGVIEAYKERERGMQLRVEALAFHPGQSWTAAEKEEAQRSAGLLLQSGPAGEAENVEDHRERKPLMREPTEGSTIDDELASASRDTTRGMLPTEPTLPPPLPTEPTLPPPASVLGVRLLRKVAQLQQENDELGLLLEQKLQIGDGKDDSRAVNPSDADVDPLQRLQADLQDAHSLLAALSARLKAAELKASRAEAALEATVRHQSTAMQ